MKKIFAFYREKKSYFVAKGNPASGTILVDEVLLKDSLDDVKQIYKSKDILASALPAKAVVKKTLPIPPGKKKDQLKAIDVKIPTLTFIPLDELVWDVKLKNEVRVFFTTHPQLNRFLTPLQEENLQLDYLTIKDLALVRFVKTLEKKLCDSFLLYFGEEESLFVYMKESLPFASVEIPLGRKDLGKEELSFEQLQKTKKGKEGLDQLQKELLKGFSSFNLKKAIPLFCTGQSKIILPWLQNTFKNWTSEVLYSEKNESLQHHAISIGIILDMVAKDGFSINYCRQQHTSKKRLRKLLFSLTFCFIISIIGTTFLFSHYSKLFQNSKNSLQQELLQLIENDQKRSLRSIPLKLSGNIEQDLSTWEQQLKKEASFFPFLQKKPKIYPFLYWLYHSELFPKQEGRITQIHTKYISYPTTKDPKKPYTIQVTLTVEPSDLFDFLQFKKQMKSCPFFDPKKEIQWKKEKEAILLTAIIKP